MKSFEECGAHCAVYASVIGEETYVVRGSNCHDRFCVPCATARSYAVAAKLMERTAAAGGKLAMITLTLRARAGENLRDNLDRLLSGFRQLRRLKMWDDAVRGGAAVVEVKRGKQQQWHSHVHAIVEASFIDQRQLSHAWRGITGDSFITHITRVKNAEEATRYVAKYASKPMESGFWHVPSLLEESIMALRGRRLITTFGTWHNAADELDDTEELWTPHTHPADFVRLGSLSMLFKLMHEGNAAASRVLALIRCRDPLSGERLPIPPPTADGGERDRIRSDSVIASILAVTRDRDG